MLILFGHPFSFNTRKLHWALEEFGLAYDYRTVDLLKQAQKQPDFLAINPNGRVPALQDGELVLYESNAILAYLARKTGKLEGRGERGYGETWQWLAWQASDMSPIFHAWFAKFMASMGAPFDEAKHKASVEASHAPLSILEQHLGKRSHLADETFTVADIAIAEALTLCADGGIDLEPYPSLRRWHGEMTSRPAFARSRPKT